MHGDVLLDGSHQFRNAAEHAIAQAFGRNVAEEALDHIEPGCRGGSEMNMEARMLGEPFFDVRVLVGGVVVAHQMQRLVGIDAMDASLPTGKEIGALR